MRTQLQVLATWQDLLNLFAAEYHGKLQRMSRLNGVTHLVVFEQANVSLPDRCCLAFGPELAYHIEHVTDNLYRPYGTPPKFPAYVYAVRPGS